MDRGERTADQRYTLLSRLGQGGMAEVWRARDERFKRDVAMKFLLKEEDFSETFADAGWSYQELEERFLYEAGVMARLQHPGIPTVLDLVADEPDKRLKRRYIVMQFVEGRSLGDLLDEHHSLCVEETACLAAQVCSALAQAHVEGVVHRDVKPDNLMVDRAGLVKVVDFGIATPTDSGIARMTRTSQPSPGTVGYRSPESYDRKNRAKAKVSEASDLYSLGCVMYRALSAGPVFEGSTEAEMAAHMTETPVPLLDRNSSVPPKLAGLVDQMLLKEPEERPCDAWEVYERVIDHIPVRGNGFVGRDSYDLTRPFLEPCRPLPRGDAETGAFRAPAAVVPEPDLNNRSANVRLRQVREQWKAGDRESAIAAAESLLLSAKEVLTSANRVTLKIWVDYAGMLKEVGRGAEAEAELRELVNRAEPHVGMEHSRVVEALELLREIEGES